ncbi:hypothetical protein [Streptacidiphilus sp. MAP5-3]|uniref:hypothetical protein n=1 Tax=unclassified Streptacidiphilus TaxID=2643834 RepID=UPI00351462A7
MIPVEGASDIAAATAAAGPSRPRKPVTAEVAALLVQAVPAWALPGSRVLAPHLARADLGCCPPAVTSAFGAMPGTTWPRLHWPADPARHPESAAALNLCTPLLARLPFLDPGLDHPRGQALLDLLLSQPLAEQLPLTRPAAGFLTTPRGAQEWLRADLGTLLARRILHARLTHVLELCFVVNLVLNVLADLETPSRNGWVAALQVISGPPPGARRRPARTARHPLRGPRATKETAGRLPVPPAVVPLPGPAPEWAHRVRVDDARIADLLPASAAVLPAGTVFAAAYHDPLAAVVLAGSLDAVQARLAHLDAGAARPDPRTAP